MRKESDFDVQHEIKFLNQRRGSKASLFNNEVMLDVWSKIRVFDQQSFHQKTDNMMRFNATTALRKRGFQCYDIKENYFES